MNEVQKQVIHVLEEISLSSIDRTSLTLAGDLALDSLRMVMLLITLEDTFHIEFGQSDMNPFLLITVEDVIQLVDKYVGEGDINHG